MTAVPPRPAAPVVEGLELIGPDCRCSVRPDVHRHIKWNIDPDEPAPDATAGDGLELQSQLYALLGGRTSTPLGVEWQHERLRRLVSDVLALPALRDVLAAAARDAERVAKVREVAEWCEAQAESRSHYAKVDPNYRGTVIPYEAAAERIRRALDGDR